MALTVILVLFMLLPPLQTEANLSPVDMLKFRREIVDYRGQLNRQFHKVRRKETRYIILHTSEGGLEGTLKVVSRGKRVRGGNTDGGHAHYVVARDGRVFRTLDRDYIADHAGLSVWNGYWLLNDISVGIEIVGYHYDEITDAQYESLTRLIKSVQDAYQLDDMAVLTHSQVSYGLPNRWFPQKHRGRKRDGVNIDRTRAGLGTGWDHDPDVAAGRIFPDDQLAAIHYGGPLGPPALPPQPAATPETAIASSPPSSARQVLVSNVITRENTAWRIAGEDYDDPGTLYQLPDGRMIPGDKIAETIGWDRIPQETQVILGQESVAAPLPPPGPVKTIGRGITAWIIAGSNYRKSTTIYFFPDGRVRTGAQIRDWDGLPPRTQILVGYTGPHPLPPKKKAGKPRTPSAPDRKAVFLLPDKSLVTGDKVHDMNTLPFGTRLFRPVKPA